MKKIIIYTMLFLFASSSFGQQTIPPLSPTLPEYLEKSKKQKRVANILLASGAVLITTSFIIPRGELVDDGICVGVWCDDKYKNDGIKSAFFIAGGLFALGSIPLYIVSG